MNGKIRITHDLYGVAERIKEIDDRYEVWYDRVVGRYEIHAGGALQIAVPFAQLDARTVRLVRETRVERTEQIVGQIEAANRIAEERALKALAERAERAAGSF